MTRPEKHFDWRQWALDEPGPGVVVDSRPRLRLMALGFAILAAVVFSRIVALELSYGAAYRAEATRHLMRQQPIAGIRGRILARDGSVLAYDKHSAALAMHYRYLEQPANPRWLRREARDRLPRAARANAAAIAAEEARVLVDRDEVSQRLATLCGISPEELRTRAAGIQGRVSRISERVNRPRRETADAATTIDETAKVRPSAQDGSAKSGAWLLLGQRIAGLLFPPQTRRPPAPITVAEELDYHVLVEDVPLEVVAEIESHADRYPGVRIVERTRRIYPAGSLAAHVVGHLGRADARNTSIRETPARGAADDATISDRAGTPTAKVGRLGMERQFETTLRSIDGASVVVTDRGGRLLSTYRQREPTVGRDLILSLDLALQRRAESLLDAALNKPAPPPAAATPPLSAAADSSPRPPAPSATGGAVVVMDVHSGALLAVASAPRFDPNWFSRGDDAGLEELLADPRHPLFDRATRMAIPPGSVFKVVTAAALLESDTVEPDTPFYCQGYLHQPDRQRCQIFRRLGLGHGETNLDDALVRSCNVYFFHFAEQMGPAPLVDWARRLGFGRSCGVDLPGESAGRVPTPATSREVLHRGWRTLDTQALAIGQSALEVTPLQVARLMAAVANGGRLVTPHVASGLGLAPAEGSEEIAGNSSTTGRADDASLVAADVPPIAPPRAIEGLSAQTLRVLRASLERVVADPDGTAHATVYLESVAIAGKTGTAETGGGRADHAWFAGYAPADKPRVALVVVLTHAGNGADAAGPIARQLVERMHALGYFGQPRAVARD
jgi:penicillin-binding protein 2